ncbi:hypothetical protein MUK42_15649 [Musa troglodytarum]|uniref:Uncharacterized protein n=1 Tax=Musa troglodytarum TaxID=320322 RepID=A0A9E7EUA9_9LILI|nr:hypothetical protein MUK42_32158 [Musa troglodytarum]URD83291.1 hypothetical protein MUK42_15649 [Musa troglodytarum]
MLLYKMFAANRRIMGDLVFLTLAMTEEWCIVHGDMPRRLGFGIDIILPSWKCRVALCLKNITRNFLNEAILKGHSSSGSSLKDDDLRERSILGVPSADGAESPVTNYGRGGTHDTWRFLWCSALLEAAPGFRTSSTGAKVQGPTRRINMTWPHTGLHHSSHGDAGPAPHHPFDAVGAELISSGCAHGPPPPPTWRVSVFRASLPSPSLPSNQPTDQREPSAGGAVG